MLVGACTDVGLLCLGMFLGPAGIAGYAAYLSARVMSSFARVAG